MLETDTAHGSVRLLLLCVCVRSCVRACLCERGGTGVRVAKNVSSIFHPKASLSSFLRPRIISHESNLQDPSDTHIYTVN